MKLIDTHSHIYGPEFDEDRAEVYERARSAGVEALVLPAIDSECNGAMFEMARTYDNCYPLIGLHPTSVNDNPQWRSELAEVERLLAACNGGASSASVGSAERPVEHFWGVGEVGLDFYWSADWKAEQSECFRRQVELSIEYDLPLVVHTRNAWDEMLTLLEEYKGRARGILHAFGEGIEVYERIKRPGGFVVGIGGVVTYKKSALAESVPHIDLADMVLETDAPWLTPVPFRGKRNESGYLTYICNRVAELKGVSPDEVAKATTQNAKRVFGL
ncbi:MAG: TatD family hydrolase [Tidjanibacter sp.]|nr:TatD family hydrolase [Tidjanibacter sp.]